MALYAGSSLMAPAATMISPCSDSCGKNLKGRMLNSVRMPMMPKHNKPKYIASFICSYRKPISIAAVSRRKHFGAPDMDLSLFTDAALKSDGYFHRLCALSTRHQSLKTIIPRASNDTPFSKYFKAYSKEEKPRWYWRTLACIPYLMPLHIMSVYAFGAHQFLPFLDQFEMLTNPFTGSSLPHWFIICYNIGVYLIIRRKEWPHFFRFHVIMALLLENALQIIVLVVQFIPYWSKLDASFWTVVACWLLFVVIGSINGALRGTYFDTPLFSEAAFMHAYLR